MNFKLDYYTLKQYTELLSEAGILVETNIQEKDSQKTVKYISFNSQDVIEDTLFICKGAHFNQKYLEDSLYKGALAYVAESRYQLAEGLADSLYIIVSDIRLAMSIIANTYYNRIWEKIKMIGITGTKGKSSTAYFVKYIIDDYMEASGGCESAIVSGIDNYDGVIKEESHLTTPEAFDLQKHIYNAVKSDISYLTMEVSSQALKYGRVKDVIYDVGCFLNIGQDHISGIEHPDVDDYLNSKLILFSQCKNLCINAETDHYDRVMEAAQEAKVNNAKKGLDMPNIVTFGLREDADYCAYDLESMDDGIAFKVKSEQMNEDFKIGMKGLFNVENALAAIVMTSIAGIPIENIKAGLQKARVSGRMEIYTNKSKDINVIVDYAHNQMSFESLFQSTRKEYPGKKISIVFGCPGKKALGRRKELGDIAGKYSSRVYITEEDAGEEPVIKICNEIAEHVKAQNCPYEIIEDRELAIKKAIENADENTIVLITGKGRETRQKRGTEYIDTPSDVEYVETFLKDK